MGMIGIALQLFGGLGSLSKLITIGLFIAGLVTGYVVWRQSIYNEGWYAHEAAVARADKKVIESAKAARGTYLDCTSRGMSWDTRTGKCSGR